MTKDIVGTTTPRIDHIKQRASKPPLGLDSLRNNLYSQDLLTRIQAVEGLGELIYPYNSDNPDPRAELALIDKLQRGDASPVIKKALAYRLGFIKDTENRTRSIEVLGNSLLTDKDRDVRKEAAKSLGKIGNINTMMTLLSEAAEKYKDDRELVKAINTAIEEINTRQRELLVTEFTDGPSYDSSATSIAPEEYNQPPPDEFYDDITYFHHSHDADHF